MEDKEFLLTIIGKQTDGEDSDEVELFTTGNFFRTDHSWCIAYDESEATGFEGNRTVVELEDDLEELESDRESNYDIAEEYREFEKEDPKWGVGAKVGVGFLISYSGAACIMGWEEAGIGVGIIGIAGLIGVAFLIFRHMKKVKKYEEEHSQWKAKRKELRAKAIEAYSKRKAEIYEMVEALLAGK